MAQLQRVHVILICDFNIVSSPVAVVGNALIIATIWRNSSLRTPSYIFLDGIAITDFFTGLITQPAFIAYMFGNPSLFNNKTLRITALRIFNTIGRYFYSVTIVTATVMAIERWFYMSRRSFITVRRAYFIFATILVALVPFSMLRLWLVPQESIRDFFDLFTMGSLSVVCLAITWVFLGVAETIVSSLLCCGVGIVQCLFNLLYYVIGVRNTKKPPITSFSYFKVFCIIKRQQLQVVAINQASQNLGQPAAINLTKYRKSVSTILYILLLFWGTFLPQAICVSIVFFNNNRADTKMAYSIFHVAATLCFLSSALNPLLYNWRLKDIRQEVKLLIRKIACKN